MRSAPKLALLAALLVAVGVAALTIDLPDVAVLRDWIVSIGPMAPAAFVIGYALTVPAPIPKSILNAVAGMAFGLAAGAALVVVGATAGAVLAFVIARVVGREAVEAMAAGRLDRVDAAIERHGVFAALVVRFVPILPFTILNYACGVTSMRLRHYAIGTAVGVIPGCTAMVALASAGARLSLWVPIGTSLVLALVSTGIGLAWHRRAQRRQAPPQPAVG